MNVRSVLLFKDSEKSPTDVEKRYMLFLGRKDIIDEQCNKY